MQVAGLRSEAQEGRDLPASQAAGAVRGRECQGGAGASILGIHPETVQPSHGCHPNLYSLLTLK